jgi:cysteine desulfurase
MERIYLDANATTPLDPRVRDAMIPWLDAGNPSSPHTEGRVARAAIDDAREQVAALIGASAREIIFTSGATESNALALLGTLRAGGGRRAACTAIEHPSVLHLLKALRPSIELDILGVDDLGRLDPGVALPEDAALVSIMLANNETGTILPVAACAARTRAIVHCDAVQACGKTEVDVGELGVDLLSLSAHKMGGPKGAGALFVRNGTRIEPIAHGGEHERGLRAGTENVAGIVGLGVAAELAAIELGERRAKWSALSAHLFKRIRDEIPGARINSPEQQRIQNTLSVTLRGAEGEAVLLGLDLEGIAVATGSACSSGAAEPSHVIRALGLSREDAESSIRISMHARTSRAEIDRCVDTLVGVVKKLRALSV